MLSINAHSRLSLRFLPSGISKHRKEVAMLVALAVLLLIVALAGGIAVNPLLFLIALLALVVFLGGGRRGTVL
jgi:hypothetical protein